MKKFILILFLGALGMTTLNQINSVVISNKFIKKNINPGESIFTPVDWKQTKEDINKIITLIKKTTISSDDQEILEKVKEKAFDYVADFENRNSSFETVVVEIKNNEKEFKKEFESQWDYGLAKNLYLLDDDWSGGPKGNWLGRWMGGYKGQWLGSSGTSWQKPPEIDWVNPNVPIPDGEEFPLPPTEAGRQDFLDKWLSLENFGYLAQGTSIAMAIVSAGLWFFAIFGGLTAYWATLATTISAIFGVLSTTTKMFVNENKYIYEDTKEKRLADAILIIRGAKTLLKEKALIDFGFLVSAETAAVASGWMFPLITSLVELGIFITNYYFYFVPPN